MVDLAPSDDCGHYDSGTNDKDNVTDTTVTARKGDMTDGTLYLTSTTRKDTLHDPCTGSGGLGRIRQDCSRRHGTAQDGITQSDMTERAGRDHLTQSGPSPH